jgi:hypothetical protein
LERETIKIKVMNNKVLVFGIGVAFGYLLGRELMGKGTTIPQIQTQTQTKSQKEIDCENQLGDQLAVVRMTADALESYKKEFMAKCLNEKATA